MGLLDNGTGTEEQSVNDTPSADYSQAPAYIVGADAHNYGNGDFAISDPSTWGQFPSDITKFIVGSVGSGLTSIYNSGVTVSNWLGNDAPQSDTQQVLSNLDDDVGQYYSQHKPAEDLVGFLATSLIPGTAGIKVLNAGQKVLGAVEDVGMGANLARATGLLPDAAAKFAQSAASDIASSGAQISLLNQNVLKALASGVGQNFLEGAAFTTAVQATMFKSPILDQQNGWDIASNILTGGLLQGAIGGVFSAAKVLGVVKRGVTAADEILQPSTFINELPTNASASDRIVQRLQDISDTRQFTDLDDFTQNYLNQFPNAQNLDAQALFNRYNTNVANRSVKLNNLLQQDVSELVGGDKELTEQLTHTLSSIDPIQAQGNVEQLLEAGRITSPLKTETQILNRAAGKGFLEPLDENGPVAAGNKEIQYVKLFGDDVGTQTNIKPLPEQQSLADRLGSTAATKAKVDSYGFQGSQDFSKIASSDLDKAESRYIWAAGQKIANGQLVHATDIPLLEQAYLQKVPVNLVGLENDAFRGFSPNYEPSAAWLQKMVSVPEKNTFITATKEPVGEDLGKGLTLVKPYGYKSGNEIWSKNGNVWNRVGKITADKDGRIENLAVSPAYQNQGLAQKLIGAAVKSGEVNPELIPRDLSAAGAKAINRYRQANNTATLMQPRDMLQHLNDIKIHTAQDLQNHGKNTDYIAKVTNTNRDFLEHTASADPTNDLFARQAIARDYTQNLISKGLWSQAKGEYPLDYKPSWAKVAYSTKAYKDADGNVVRGMARITVMQKVAQQAYDNVFAKAVGDEGLAARFIAVSKQVLNKANRFGSGPGFTRFANGAYGSLASHMEVIGKATSDLQRLLKENVGTELDGPLYRLGSKPQAAVEFSSINAEAAATTEKYVLVKPGGGESPYLMSRAYKRYQDAIAAGKNPEAPQIQQGARIQIPITNSETADAIEAHIKTNGDRITTFKEMRSAQGLEDSKDAETFYPLKPNVKDYPHFAFVVDPTISGAGHIKMIHAPDADTLGSLIQKVPEPYRVITKQQSEEFHKTIDDYDYERTLHENYIDSEIQSKGINSEFFPKTDPAKIVQDVKDWHLRNSDVLARELVNMKYQTEFAELRRLGEQFDVQNKSVYGGTNRYLEDSTKNPYTGYIKTALNISRQNENVLWKGLNDKLDSAVSSAFDTVHSIFQGTKSPEDLDAVNTALQQYGLKTPYQDAATMLLANKSPNVGALRTFISRANGLLATLTLRLDPMNSLNYAIGHQVLNGTEFTSILRGIRNANPDVAGKLAELSQVELPQVKDFITSPGKLISNALKNFVSESTDKAPNGKILTDWYRENGWIKDGTKQFRDMLSDLAIDGSEKSSILSQRLSTAFTKAKELGERGATLSGSKLSEQFQGFIAADVMRQITDIARNAGVIGADEQRAYINTFVNRVRGNLLASQRPLMFQGPIGQAIGLFQTYQFNILQQLLRHVAEGNGKDVATLLGLQGTIYGMQSLPAFNFINQHIVGTASGNPMHRDLYDATYGVLGKTAGDFLMYGLPSNLLRANFYSRGDLNPRNITVIPTSLSEIPIVNSYGRFFGNLKDMATNAMQGGNLWQTFLGGLEHNAVSRPLAGLAQALQATTTNGYAYSTSSKGNILGANDLYSIGTLARLAGAKPLDEAIANDATYRVAAYQAADVAKQEQLGETVKTTLRAGQQPSQEQVHQFASEYAAAGGNQRNFSKWMFKQMVTANTSQANRLASNLNSSYSQGMQRIMGGGYALDGTRIDPVSGQSYTSENPSVGNTGESQ